MKKSKIALLLILVCIVIFAGCARSDVTLNVHKDGSFTADIQYGIDKSLMGNDEVKNQVKSLITDTLDENNIPYTEGENDDFVIITVTREFKDLNQITSVSAWQGISMVPRFSSVQAEGSLWARIEDGKFKLSGTLNSETFGAKDFVEQNSEVANGFGGSLTVVTEEKPHSADGGEAVGDTGYKWGGSSSDSKTVSFESAKLTLPDGYDEGIKPMSPSAEESVESDNAKEEKNSAVPIVGIVIIACLAVGIIVFVVRKKKKQ